ncbi:ABC transporter ATP-binding protein [Pseudomonas oryzihabitans]|uniref:ABC transporter ATP-binding protein n=1 Tax=Pseudomonas rhizoryzae TaxID=2571129 RepID=UPI000736B08D|nr:ABC transporter ATP-binding protein [Pseudomonas rhizoryzae]APQ10676.1 ABC transporter ATP-binding protein [Pseudomonas psychrotolerans]KTS74877.1 ABC transporter ATP-binding protein [Pseudomonas psychrotolerans]KTT28173.1 ABC transporter ATP-binding protein [Pseudomonas psychrotolerans]KTT32758.1 ABC transporter ATP-binding protein [Pseudomonas psychrotolerans]KTT70915.1 ABC transporter ATP-binding protein [Pseudomonas psychrotolerans]
MAKDTQHSLSIDIEHVTKTYDSFAALDDVSLSIRSGEFLSLLGSSGSGKTTLLMALAGFVRPDAGSIRFGGREMVFEPPHKRDLGMMFQNYALFPHMDVFQNVAYPLKLRGYGRDDIRRRVQEALELVELDQLVARKINEMSGGQRQRIALARAIVFEPKVLLMDEPLSALDKRLREAMQLELRRLHERLGMTVVYVTHDQREALTMSDRIAVMSQGRIQQIDTPKRLYERPVNRFIAEFVGESSFLPVTVRDGRTWFQDQLLEATLSTSGLQRPSLLLRPEKLRFVSDQDSAFNRFRGTITDVIYQGESQLIQVDLGQGQLTTIRRPSRTDHAPPPARGDRVTLGLHPQDTYVVGE